MKRSKLFRVNLRDLAHGAIGLFVGTFITALIQVMEGGNVLPTSEQLKKAAVGGLVVTLSYLLKQVFTNSEGRTMKREKRSRPSLYPAGQDAAYH
jgi:hypothetical protein